MLDPSTRPFSIGDVRGRNVIDSHGDNVGTIQDVVVDPSSWKVSGFVVALRRDLAQRFHVRSGMFDSPTVEVGADRIRTVGDNVVLNIEADVIGDALARSDTPRGGHAPPYGLDEPYRPATSPLDEPLDRPPYEPPRY